MLSILIRLSGFAFNGEVHVFVDVVGGRGRESASE